MIKLQRSFRPIAHFYTDFRNSSRIREIVKDKFPLLELNEESIVFDLGLNRGRFSLALAPTKAFIIAFEPNPFIFSHAVKILSKWNNIVLLQAAVVAKRGVYDLYFHKFHSQDPVGFSRSSSLAKDKTNVNFSDHVKVVGLEFEHLIQSFSKIHLIKFDIEGGELDLFDSLMRNFEQIEYLLVELHQDRVPGTREKIQELKSFISRKGLENNWLLDWE